MSPGASGAAAEVLAGRYRLDERIGVGAMGEVWRARDLTLERDVAVKRVRLDGHVDEQAQSRFRREAVVMAGLSHPNVVSVYDAGTDVSDGTEIAYLVMELLDGPSCSELIRTRRALSFAEVQRIASGVARGLAAAHQAGIVHRDIKPGNVVVSRGVPKIVDFGIARLEQESAALLTAPQTTVGTAAYMSPEQALGEPAGPPSDIYSLGALMIALATGSPPFGASNALALMRAHVDDAPRSLADLRERTPPHLSDLIDRMLAKDPGLRPTASEVARALDEGELAASPVSATKSLPAVGVPPDSAGTPRSHDPLASPAPPEQERPASAPPPIAYASAGPADGPSPSTVETPVAADPLLTAPAEDPPPRRSRRGGMWWALAAVLLVLAGFVALNLLLDRDPATEDTDGTAAPTVTPTERIVTPESPLGPTAAPAPTTAPSSPAEEPATADLDAAVSSAGATIAAVEDSDARDDLLRSWQRASNGLQGANSEAQLREVIAEAEELADDDDLSEDELTAIRSAIEQVIALL